MPCVREWSCVDCVGHQCYYLTLLNETQVCMYDDAPIYTWVVTTDKTIDDCDIVPNPWRTPTILSGAAGGLVLVVVLVFMVLFWIRSRRRGIELSEVRRLLNRREEAEEGGLSTTQAAVADHFAARAALRAGVGTGLGAEAGAGSGAGTGAGVIYETPKKEEVRMARIVRTLTETEF